MGVDRPRQPHPDRVLRLTSKDGLPLAVIVRQITWMEGLEKGSTRIHMMDRRSVTVKESVSTVADMV